MAAHFKSLNNGHMSNGDLRTEILEYGKILLNHPSIHKMEFDGVCVCVYDFKGEFDKKPARKFYDQTLDNIRIFGTGVYTELLISHGIISDKGDEKYGWYITTPSKLKSTKL